MPQPTDRDNKVLVNKYYPNGLKEGQIYDHYIKYKKEIIDFCKNRPIILFNYFNNVNSKEIVIRLNRGKPIRLNEKNYESIISGHTLSMSVLTSEDAYNTNEYVIDIDPGNITSEKKIKKAAIDVADAGSIFFSKNYMITNSAHGYHIRFYMNKYVKLSKAINQIKDNLNDYIKVNSLENEYDINKKGPSYKINLDLTPMYKNQGATVLYALTRKNGLMCMDVTNTINNYNRRNSVIK